MSLNAPEAAMIADEYSWLVHKLCGPNVDSGDVHDFGRRLSGSSPMRSPGTLAETVVRRVKENGTENARAKYTAASKRAEQRAVGCS